MRDNETSVETVDREWADRAQPVNGYGMASHVTDDKIEAIYPNIVPTIEPETA